MESGPKEVAGLGSSAAAGVAAAVSPSAPTSRPLQEGDIATGAAAASTAVDGAGGGCRTAVLETVYPANTRATTLATTSTPREGLLRTIGVHPSAPVCQSASAGPAPRARVGPPVPGPPVRRRVSVAVVRQIAPRPEGAAGPSIFRPEGPGSSSEPSGELGSVADELSGPVHDGDMQDPKRRKVSGGLGKPVISNYQVCGKSCMSAPFL